MPKAMPKKETVKVAPPEPKVIAKVGKKLFELDADVGMYLIAGATLKAKIDAFKEELADVNEHICAGVDHLWEEVDSKTVTITFQGVTCKVSLKEEIKISDPESLRGILGDRWSDLVRETVSYKPERKLVDLALDADDPASDILRRCMVVTEAKPSVTYSGSKE